MEIDIKVKAPRNFKNARNVPVRIRVGVGAAADQVGALLARRDQKFLCAGIVEQAFLRDSAYYNVDGPGVVALEPADRIETLQTDARIDLDVRAHAHRALHDRLLQG